MGRNFNMLSEVRNGKEVKSIEYLSVDEVVDMDVEVASDGEFMRGGGCVGKKRREFVKKGRERLRVR